MFLALAITFVFVFIVWLVFFRLKLLKFSIAWGVVSGLIFVHVLLIFLIGLRFVTPYSTEATVIQHTIQLIPRLPNPTLVTGVLVEPNVPVKKGQPLFQFDRRPYQYKVRQLEAALAQAQQGVSVLQADLAAAVEQVAKLRSELVYVQAQAERYRVLVSKQAGSDEELQKWSAQLHSAQAALKQAQADEQRSRAKYGAQVDGVNAGVVQAQADLTRPGTTSKTPPWSLRRTASSPTSKSGQEWSLASSATVPSPRSSQTPTAISSPRTIKKR